MKSSISHYVFANKRGYAYDGYDDEEIEDPNATGYTIRKQYAMTNQLQDYMTHNDNYYTDFINWPKMTKTATMVISNTALQCILN